MLVTFHAHGETGRYHSYRRGSNNLDQSISDRSLQWTEDRLLLVEEEETCVQLFNSSETEDLNMMHAGTVLSTGDSLRKYSER